MQWLDALRPHLLALPSMAKFAIVIAIIVGAPALARRLRVPELILLLAFGVLLGPHVLGVAGTDHPIAQFFADLGKLMLMFTAGLEIDINLFRRAQNRSVIFGIITTIFPQLLGPHWVWRSAIRLFSPSSSARYWHRTPCSVCRSSRASAPSVWRRSSSRSVPRSYLTHSR